MQSHRRSAANDEAANDEAANDEAANDDGRQSYSESVQMVSAYSCNQATEKREL